MPHKVNGLFQASRIDRVRKENADTLTLFLDASLPDASPGQFVMAWLPGVGEKPFSISGNDPLTLTVCAVGPVSRALCELKPANRLWVRGPLGKGFVLSGETHILVGGGYGAAPLYFLAKKARALNHEVTLCLGAKTRTDLILLDQFEALGCRVLLATEDGSAGAQGLVSLPLLQALEHNLRSEVYACGPTGMLLTVHALCRRVNLSAQLSFEALIRCGIGLCGSCELSEETCQQLGVPSGFLICSDGPVLKSAGLH